MKDNNILELTLDSNIGWWLILRKTQFEFYDAFIRLKIEYFTDYNNDLRWSITDMYAENKCGCIYKFILRIGRMWMKYFTFVDQYTFSTH